MAFRWTVSKAYVVAKKFRVSEHKTEEDVHIDNQWADICDRTPKAATLLYGLSQYPESTLFLYFNVTMSMRKLEDAIDKQKDFSLEEPEGDDDDETPKERKERRGRRKAENQEEQPVQRNLLDVDTDLNVDSLLDDVNIEI